MKPVIVRTVDLAKVNCHYCLKPMIVHIPQSQRHGQWRAGHSCWKCVGNTNIRNGIDESNAVDITNEIIEFGGRTTTIQPTAWYGKTIE